MIALQIADLVLIAGRVLDLDTAAALDLLDLTAAEAALAAVPPAEPGEDPAGQAAGQAAALLHALIRQRPFRRGNQPVALAATLQFLALNGWQAELGPPEAASAMVTEVAEGTLGPAGLAGWLAPRLRPTGDTRSKEGPMRRWLPGRKRPDQRTGGLFTRFTGRAREAVTLAQDEARLLNHNYIGTEHVLLGLIREGDGLAARALTSVGISLEAVRAQVAEIIGEGQGQPPAGHIPFTPRAKKVLELSLREALRLGHNYIGTEHVLLGLIREGEGVAAQVLVKLGADHQRLRELVLRLMADDPSAPGGGRESRGGTAGPPSGVSDPLDSGHLDSRLVAVRRAKEAAIAAQDGDTAAALGAIERQLLDSLAQRERAATAGSDVEAMVVENRLLHREIERLRGLLRQHGIEPDGDTSQTA